MYFFQIQAYITLHIINFLFLPHLASTLLRGRLFVAQTLTADLRDGVAARRYQAAFDVSCVEAYGRYRSPLSVLDFGSSSYLLLFFLVTVNSLVIFSILFFP